MSQPLIQFVQSLHSFASATGSANCGGYNCDTGLPSVGTSTNELQELLQIFFGILAALAVLMIVLAGLRYITAQGNPQETSKARDTILYAVVGLVIAISAEAIVSLVLGSVK